VRCPVGGKGEKRDGEGGEAGSGRARLLYLPYGAPPSLFGGSALSFLFEGDTRARAETAQGSRKKGKSRARVVSARTSATAKDPLLCPHYIVYLSSEPLLSPLLSASPLALGLLVSRSKQLPLFPLRTKADLRTCPSRRTAVNDGIIIVTYYRTSIRGKKVG